LEIIGTQYVESVCEEIEERATSREGRQALVAYAFTDFKRLRRLIQQKFLLQTETAPGQTGTVSK
jgi:hypothetical protein